MLKNASFAVAATTLGLAILFWAKSSVVATSADLTRPQVGISIGVMAGLFLPVKAVEPVW
jgi:hypothetical protein